MVSIMIEDVISNKLVFFISKLNKNVEAPPVNCNAEEEEQKTKQSELARILEQIYMYISGFIVCVFIIFILIVQCPHPWTPSTYKINDNIGTVLLRFTDILTKFIVENKYGKNDSNKKNKGSGMFASLNGSNGKVGEVPALDDMVKNTTQSDRATLSKSVEGFGHEAEAIAFANEARTRTAETATNVPPLNETPKKDTPKKIYGEGGLVDTTAEFGREGYSEAFFGPPEAQQSQLPSKKQTFLASFGNKKNQTLAQQPAPATIPPATMPPAPAPAIPQAPAPPRRQAPILEQQPARAPAIPGNGGEEKI